MAAMAAEYMGPVGGYDAGDYEGEADGGAATSPMDGGDMTWLNVHGGGAFKGEVPLGFEGIDSHVLDAAPRARLTDEERLEREVTRRRLQDLERRARIFDAKRRNIGVDKEFLDKQVADKTERKKVEAELTRIADRQFMGVNRVMQINETEKNRMRFEAERATKEYSLRHLNFQSRDVFDLNDPKAVTKAVPARLGDTDPRCGPSSLQQFNGEDLHKAERERQQKLQMVNTLEQQVFEKQMLRRMNEGGDDHYQAETQEIIDACNLKEEEESGLRKAIMKQHQAELMDNIQAVANGKQAEQMRQQTMNQRELDFHARDQFLQENRPHVLPNGKAMPSLYKGSTREERVEVFGQQLEQCQEKAMVRAHEGMFDRAQHMNVEMSRKQLVMMEREKQRMRRAMAMEVAAHNRGMVQGQKDALDQAGPDGHKNKVNPEFFEQFGVGTR